MYVCICTSLVHSTTQEADTSIVGAVSIVCAYIHM
jgi:hypothetical protein